MKPNVHLRKSLIGMKNIVHGMKNFHAWYEKNTKGTKMSELNQDQVDR